MGLFDAIEQLNSTEEQPVNARPRAQLLPRPSVRETTPPRTTAPDQHHPLNKENELDTWQPSPAEIEERRRILNRKPERLSFLAPCPVCHGRAFLHIEGGGFVCRACTPGLFGYPVEACGPDLLAPARDADLLMAGSDPTTNDSPPTDTTPTEEQQLYFAAAWAWIKENKAGLLTAGWTMTALVRRGKYRWPVGSWGLAWMPVWTKPGLVVTIVSRGEIVFTFRATSGRQVTQTAWPPIPSKNQYHAKEEERR